jgi:hypothetical protein
VRLLWLAQWDIGTLLGSRALDPNQVMPVLASCDPPNSGIQHRHRCFRV